MTHRRVAVNGITLHLAEAGEGPPVVLLHGFPEFWYSWRHQLPALASAGYHAVAPDLRGYNESDRPTGVGAYRLSLLVEDVADLIRELGGHATVVGHDWGGIIAWRLALDRPELVERLVVLNAPHPSAFLRGLPYRMQWLRSSYILFFQLPGLPERLFRAGNFAVLRRTLRHGTVRPDAFTRADVARYREAFAAPDALTGPLNYYRALLRHPGELHRPPQRVEVPTLVIWGEQDAYLGVHLTDGLAEWVPSLRLARLPDASHWVQNDAPERVNQLLLGFLHASSRNGALPR